MKSLWIGSVLVFCVGSSAYAAVSACSSDEDKESEYRSCLQSETHTLVTLIKTKCAASSSSMEDEMDCRDTADPAKVMATAKSTCRARAKLDAICNEQEEESVVRPEIRKKKSNIPTPPARPKTLPHVANTPSEKPAERKKAESKPVAQTPSPTPPRKPTTNTNAAQKSKLTLTTPQEPDFAQSDADADLAWCRQLESTASRCCSNPLSCSDQLSDSDRSALGQVRGLLSGQGPQQMGLTEYCRQLDVLSSSGSNVNAGLSAVCATQQSSCRNTCYQLVSKYQSLLNNCNGCESESIYSGVLAQLASSQSHCRNLQVRADTLASNGIGMADPTAYSQHCQSVASSLPQNGGSVSGPDPRSGLPGSTPTIPNNPKDRRGEGGFAEAIEGRGVSDFNVPSGPSSDPTAFEGIRYGAAAAALAAARTVNTVPNNSGGAIPGGGDSAGGAQLGGRAASVAQTRTNPSGNVADIEKGFRSSGGYSYPSGTVADRGLAGAGGLGALQPSSVVDRQDDGGYFGLDLKQFLPGGSRDPSRRTAGSASRSQIHSKEEDIWRRISIKMIEKCRLGVLLQCH